MKVENILDASEALETLRADFPDLFAGVGSVNTKISERDGMFNPSNPRQYFRCGAEAAQICLEGLRSADLTPGEVSRVIDYACGYGRVTRFLRASFPAASILGADIDQRALSHLEATQAERTHLLDGSCDALPVEGKVDLIWVGSLFTHVPRDYVAGLLTSMRQIISDRGVLVFTMHGEYVIDRLKSREKTYNLSDDGMRDIIEQFSGSGYGFSVYPGRTGYGISAATRGQVTELLNAAGFKLVSFATRGWVKHQDAYVAVPKLEK